MSKSKKYHLMLLYNIFRFHEFLYFNWGVLVQNFQIFLRYDDTYLVLHIIFEIFSRLVETFWLGILLLFFLILVAKIDFNTHKRVVWIFPEIETLFSCLNISDIFSWFEEYYFYLLTYFQIFSPTDVPLRFAPIDVLPRTYPRV